MKKVEPVLEQFVEDSCPGSMNYEEYQELIAKVHAEDKTTGDNQSDMYVEYSKLNEHRMRRLNKTIRLNASLVDRIKSIAEEQLWLVITEAWCGDAAQNLPIVVKMAEVNDKIQLRLILRDEHPEIMNLYLTNGGKSIPKLIAIDTDNNELFHWGPRPEPMQKIVVDYHNSPEPKAPHSEYVLEVQKWYNADKTHTIQNELESILSKNLS